MQVSHRRTLNAILNEHGSPAAIHFFLIPSLPPNRATEPKCKLMLAKSPESAHKKS